jgi:hypothetical protein
VADAPAAPALAIIAPPPAAALAGIPAAPIGFAAVVVEAGGAVVTAGVAGPVGLAAIIPAAPTDGLAIVPVLALGGEPVPEGVAASVCAPSEEPHAATTHNTHVTAPE